MTALHPLVELLAAERRTRGLRQQDAANRAGLAESTLSYWETGARQPILNGLELYARALGYRITAVPLEADDCEEGGPDPDVQLPLGELVIGDGEKHCNGCSQVRPRSQFYRDKSRRDGLQSRCKFCVNERNERNERRHAGLEAPGRGEGAA